MKSLFASAVFVCAITPPVLGAPKLYGVATQFIGGELDFYEIDVTTGAATLIGPTGLENLIGLSFSSDGILYTASGDTIPRLHTIDLETGDASVIGNLGLSPVEGGIAFQPQTDTLYAEFGSAIVGTDPKFGTIDIITGHATVIGTHNRLQSGISGLSFHGDGTLYGVRFFPTTNDALVTIDIETAAVTTIGELGTTSSSSNGGIDFDPVSGELFMSNGESLYTVDITTGDATYIGDHGGIVGMAGLAFAPEPGTFAFFALAAAAAIRRRPMRNS